MKKDTIEKKIANLKEAVKKIAAEKLTKKIKEFEDREFISDSDKSITCLREISFIKQGYNGAGILGERSLHQEDEIYHFIVEGKQKQMYEGIIIKDKYFEKYTPDKIAEVFASIDFIKYLSNQLPKTSSDEEPEKTFESTSAKERFEYLKQLGFFSLPELRQSNTFSQKSKWYILSKILNVNERTARGMINGEEKYCPDEKTINKVKEKLSSIKNRV